MGLGFSVGMRIPWESHGNANRTATWEWEWEIVGVNLDWNGNEPYSPGENSHGFYCYRLDDAVAS